MESGVMPPLNRDMAARSVSATIMGFVTLCELGQYGVEDNGFSAERWGKEVTDQFLKGLQGPDCADGGGSR